MTTIQGPPSMFAVASEPYKAWQKFGQMVQEAKPRGLVVVSAHWENESGGEGVRGEPCLPFHWVMRCVLKLVLQ